jgi:hypothetical protein
VAETRPEKLARLAAEDAQARLDAKEAAQTLATSKKEFETAMDLARHTADVAKEARARLLKALDEDEE